MRELRHELDIITAIRNKNLIGDEVSPAQETLLRTVYGLPLEDLQLEIYRRATDRQVYEPREYREIDAICGRRSGKSSRIAANVAVFEAALRQHRLARGERANVIVLAPTQAQARVTFNYIRARLEGSPILKKMIRVVRADEIELSNRVTVAVWSCNFRSIRGLSIAACIAEEQAFWRDDSGANPAEEVLAAIRPAMATFAGGKLLKVSSPWAKSGSLWTDFQRRLECIEPLVWKLPSREMNPSLNPDYLAAERERDPARYAVEFGAEFAESASALLAAEDVDACVVRGHFEIPPQPRIFPVFALDAAFKSDAFAFSGAFRTNDGRVVVAVCRSWKPERNRPVQFAEVLSEIVSVMHSWNAMTIYGDQLAAEPIRQALAKEGIVFEQIATLGRRAAGIYQSLRALVGQKQLEIPDDPELVSQLKKLEHIVLPGGGERVEAATGHDDKAVAVALAVHKAVSEPISREPMLCVLDGHEEERLARYRDEGWLEDERLHDRFFHKI